MADVCVIYAREDAPDLPCVLEKLLSPDYSVWWDKKIVSGNYRDVILHQLRIAGCVVPIWSPSSSNSMTVDEAEYTRQFGTPLLPIITHAGLPPLGFGSDQTTKAIGWSGESDHPAILEHVKKVKAQLSIRRGPKSRPSYFMPSKQLSLPAYFFSLSSYETKISPIHGAQALDILTVKSVLVSAQDVEKAPLRGKLIGSLQRVRRAGGVVLLDSGNYEAGRISKLRKLPDKTAANNLPTGTLDNYYTALARTPHDMAFCFDHVQPPANDVNKVVASAVKAVRRDQGCSEKPILPIVHLPYERDGRAVTRIAPQAVVHVAESLEPPMIGIPERELGDGIITRISTMKRIRNALNELRYYQPIHILGTGDPISLALLTAAGADSFDGLEWCRFVLDAQYARLYPIQDYDLFQWQDSLSTLGTAAAENGDSQALTWLGRVAVHNIDFYLNWMESLREALTDERRLIEFMTRLLPGNELGDVRAVLWNWPS